MQIYYMLNKATGHLYGLHCKTSAELSTDHFYIIILFCASVFWSDDIPKRGGKKSLSQFIECKIKIFSKWMFR